MWKVDSLLNRRLSPPAVVGSLVAVADYKGLVHFFDITNGTPAARVKSGGDRVTANPVVSGDLVIFIDVDGELNALRVVTPGA
jgi:outer membrane protein assembly factor BamB